MITVGALPNDAKSYLLETIFVLEKKLGDQLSGEDGCWIRKDILLEPSLVEGAPSPEYRVNPMKQH